jgi:divalent metal cation (Fe/Co/Zn/Cd) transporter
VLFTLGAMFSLYEGIEKLTNPHELESPAVAFVVLGVAVVLESLSLRTAVRESRPHRGGGNWLQFIRSTKNPELPVVLLEDTGALAGLALAILGLGLAVATDEPRFDAIGSIAIGILLAIIAVVLAVEMKSLLIGESASATTRAALETAMLEAPEVRGIIHTRTLQLGPEELLVAAKLDFHAPSTTELAPAIDAVEARIRAAVPEARLIYLEPDVTRDGPGPA